MNPRSIPKRVSSWVLLFASFFLAVTAHAQITVANNNGITVNDATSAATPRTATPYPSTNKVSGFVGNIQTVLVTLNGVSHQYPDDMDMLLISPAGEALILMSDAGGQFDLSNATIEFNPFGQVLPEESQIISGLAYRPADYPPVESYPDLPLITLVPGLESFSGDSPNGDWRLYVMDDQAVDAGSIGSWSLTFFLTPTITVTNAGGAVTITEDTPGSFNVFVNDTDTPLSSLVLSAQFDTNFISNVTFAGSGTNRPATITPRANANTAASGPTTVILSVFDGSSTVTTPVSLTIDPVNDAATFVALQTASTTIPLGGISTNINIRINDIDTDTNLLVLTASSSNPSIVSATNVYFGYNSLPVGTQGTNRNMRVASTGTATGTATLTFNVIDPSGATPLTNSIQFTVTVTNVAHVVAANPSAIVVPDGGEIISTNTVSGVSGLIGELEVVLLDVEHATPSDFRVVLVGPGGAMATNVVLMRNVGDANRITNVWLRFDDDASGPLTSAQITTSTNEPSDAAPGTSVGGTAPSTPYGAGLSVFEYTNPNGQWRLFVIDAAGNLGGQINGGWLMHIYTAPTISAIGTQKTTEDKAIDVAFSVADQDGSITNITATPGSGAPFTVLLSGTGSTRILRVEPIANAFGTNSVTLIAADNSGFTATNTFIVEVAAVNDAPTLGIVEKQVTRAGQPIGPISFTVNDVDDSTTALLVTASSNNPKLLPQGSLVLSGSGLFRSLLIFPAGSQAGVADITLTVTDPNGATTTRTFDLTVLEAANPIFENAGVIALPDNATAVTSTNSVSGLNGRIAELQVTLFNLTHPNPEDLDVLLVGPTGAGIYLMSDAGGSGSVTNITLVFRDNGSNMVGQVESGVFAPVNNNGADTDFAGTASTVVTSFSAFGDTDPNGNWRLFIRDDTASTRGGSLGGGWQLSIRTRPSISTIGTRTINEDATARFSIAAGDNQPGVTYVISSNITAVAPTTSNIVESLTIAQNGGNLDFTIVPHDNAYGTNSITVTVSDGLSPDPDDTETFTFVVLPIEDAPTITGLGDKSTPAATPISIPFSVSDPETPNPANIVILPPTSADQSLVSDANIAVASNGDGTHVLTIVPTGRNSGSTRITVQAVDPQNQTNEVKFTLNVTPNPGAFANTTSIPINDSPAGASISTISVSGIEGRIISVTATLLGFNHGYPDDVDILLVAPNGQTNVMLLSDAGGGPDDAVNVRLTFQNGGNVPPNETPLTNGVYVPANYNGADNEAGIAAGINQPYGSSMTAFENISNANGTWALYVRDDTFSDAGSIAGGWVLVIKTAPTISDLPDITIGEDTTVEIPFTVRDSDTPPEGLGVTATINDTSAGFRDDLFVPAGLTLTTNGNDRTLTITPTTNLWGTNEITLTVTDSNTPPTVASTTFRVVVTNINDVPVLTTVVDTNRFVTLEDQNIVIQFRVSDVDSTLTNNNLVVVSSDATIVSNTAFAIEVTGPDTAPGTTNTYDVEIDPNPNANGSIKLFATLRDSTGASTTRELTLDITAVNDIPFFTTVIPDAQVEVGESTTNLVFRIGDVETDERNLTIVNIVSSNPALIPTNNVVFSRTAESRLVQVTPIGTVSVATPVQIDVTISDANGGTATDSFVVTVVPPAGTLLANTTEIVIPGAAGATVGAASPFPSTITMGGLVGPIHRVFVTLEGLSHENPDDLDILLVSPSGREVMLMSDAGGTTDANNLRVQFRDNGRALPDEGQIIGGTNVYSASNYEGVGEFTENLAAPAPAGPYQSSLSAFRDDTQPNGVWSLYVFDDTSVHTGRIAFGWTLRVVTSPSVGAISVSDSDAVINEDTTVNISFTVQDPTVADVDDLTVSFESGNNTLFPTGTNNLQFVTVVGTPNAGGGATYTYTLVPGTNQWGTNTITAVVTRVDGAVSRSAPVTIGVARVDDPPSISRLTDRTTTEDDPIVIEIQILDPDTPRSNLRVVAESSDDTVVRDTNLVWTFSTNNSPPATSSGGRTLHNLSAGEVVRLWIIPNQDAIGDTEITVTAGQASSSSATIGNTSQASFTLNVVADNDPPVIGNITNVNVVAGEVGSTTFTVTDPEGNTITIANLSSSNTNVVRNNDISVTASGNNRTIQFITQPGVNESTVISFTVSDGVNPAIARQFTVNAVRSREVVFANNNAITINDATVNGGRATPYPSQITVSNLVGNIAKVVVTLDGFNHTFPDDVDVLLVGPNGQKVIVMSDAGGSTASTGNIVLRFDPTAATPIPDTSLAAGNHRTFNYEGVETFPDAPAGAVASDTDGLSVFNGTSPLGVWSLYILDDTASDSGSISRGWALGITTQPAITSLADITTQEDTPATTRITIAEETFASTNFNFGFTSTNLALLTPERISVSGDGLSRTITVNPLPNQTGETDVTVLVTNANGQVVSDVFHVVVTPVNDAPQIVTDLEEVERVQAGGTVAARFEFSDAETDRKDLIVTITSSNPTLIPVNNIVLMDTNIVIFTEGAATGSSQISVTVSDGTQATTHVFRVIVDPSLNPQFSSSTDMVVPEQGPASVYPSQINVTGVPGTVSRVIVTLSDITHPFPDDLDVALVGPNGRKVLLMSDAGGGGSTNAALNRARLTFDDTAASQLPDDTEITNKFGTYKPTDYDTTSDALPAPAPTGTNWVTLGLAFAGMEANGIWSLYVADDQSPDGGLVGGWTISFVTSAPTVDFIPDQTLNEDFGTNVVNFTVGDDTDPANLTVRVASSDTSIVNARIVGSGASRGVQLESVPNASGTAEITVTVQDESSTIIRTFAVTVVPVNDQPIVSGLANASTPANITLTIPFVVADVETSGANVVVSAANSTPDVATVVLNGSNGSYTLTVVPQGIWPTNTTVTVTANDGTVATTQQIVISITEPLGPSISDIPDQLGAEDTALQVPFTVTGTTSANPIITVTSSNPDLVFNTSISGSGANRSVVILLVPNAFGSSTITVGVQDEFGSDFDSFILTVPNTPDGPSIGAIADRTVGEDAVVEIPLSVTDVDTELEDLTFTAITSNTNLVSGMTFSVEGGIVIGRVSLVPNASGVAAISITVTDQQGNSAASAFALTVSSLPDAPVLAPVADLTVQEDATVTVPLTVTDGDSALNTLTFAANSSNSNLVDNITFTTTANSAAANIILVPNAFGTATITLAVSEGTNVSTQSFELTVTPVAEDPTFGPIANVTVDENTLVTIPLNVNDPDDDLENLTFFSSTEGTNLVRDVRFDISTSNTVSAVISLRTNAFGTDRVTLSVSDGNAVVSQSFNLTVNDVNISPEISPIADQSAAAGPVVVNITVNDPDTDINQLIFSASAASTNLVSGIQFAVTGPNTVRATITIRAGQTGTDRLTVQVSDGETVSQTSFNLTIGQQQQPTLSVTRTGTNLNLSVAGSAGATYVIEGTSDFATWTQVGTVTLNQSGQGTLQIPINADDRFFRARVQ